MGVILLHGLGQQSADYHRFGRFLNRHGIEVWGIDHIGHGLSEGEIDGLPSVDELAASASQLISIAHAADTAIPLAVVGHSLGAGTALIAMQSNPSAAQHISSVALTGTPVRAHTLAVPAPEVPTLVLHGQDDRRAPIGPIRSWCAGKPTVTLREFADAGHDLLHEPVHHAVSTAIVEFVLARLTTDLGPASHHEAPNPASSALDRASVGRRSALRPRLPLPVG
ncbi:alpha/beta fold hydrolase [Nocardia sp. NPDC050718]|uniref:alpha/beta hydrolase n=1 Tax=Nocardia sp. NPDC050718 TaxID=3155788 RepID=UPI0033E62E86